MRPPSPCSVQRARRARPFCHTGPSLPPLRLALHAALLAEAGFCWAPGSGHGLPWRAQGRGEVEVLWSSSNLGFQRSWLQKRTWTSAGKLPRTTCLRQRSQMAAGFKAQESSCCMQMGQVIQEKMKQSKVRVRQILLRFWSGTSASFGRILGRLFSPQLKERLPDLFMLDRCNFEVKVRSRSTQLQESPSQGSWRKPRSRCWCLAPEENDQA